jgi:hypothetical protein
MNRSKVVVIDHVNCAHAIEIPGTLGKPETWAWRRCTQPATQTRRIGAFITIEDSPSMPTLHYEVVLCDEHATEYDDALPKALPRYIREWGKRP